LKELFSDATGLELVARSDPRNAYIMRSGRGPESSDNPLPMLIYRPHGKYFLKVAEDGLVIAAASVYPYEKGKDSRCPDDNSLYLSQIGVHRFVKFGFQSCREDKFCSAAKRFRAGWGTLPRAHAS
jgi:hypothetical protein